jgi:hypothetical protein
MKHCADLPSGWATLDHDDESVRQGCNPEAAHVVPWSNTTEHRPMNSAIPSHQCAR